MAEIHFAPDGHDANDGSDQEPLATPHEAIDRAEPGDWIYGHDRTFAGVLQRYDLEEHIIIDKTGYEAAPFHLVNFRGQNPILDFSSVPYSGTSSQFQQNSLIQMRGVSGIETNWWHLRGLTIQCEDLIRPGVGTPRQTGAGILINTSHHFLERLTVRWIGRYGIVCGGTSLYGFTPGWNYILNTDVSECFHPDSYGNGSSGISCGWQLQPGNVIRWCRMHGCTNHGGDSWEATEGVLWDECWFYDNGWNLWNWPNFYGGGEAGAGGYGMDYTPRAVGDGMKCDVSHAPPRIRRPVTWNNRVCGIISGVGRTDSLGNNQSTDGWISENGTYYNNHCRNLHMGPLVNLNASQYKCHNSIILDTQGKSFVPYIEPLFGNAAIEETTLNPSQDMLLATADFSHNSFSHDTLDTSLATAKWSFDSSLTVSDIGSLTLTNNGSVTSGTGRYGNAAQFTAGKHLSMSSVAAIEADGGSFTVECWVKFDSLPTTGQLAFIAAKGVPFTAGNYEWYLYFHGTLGIPIFGVSNGTSTPTPQNVGGYSYLASPEEPESYPIGEWIKLVARCDVANETISLEVNGSFMDIVQWTGGTYSNASAALRIGGITGYNFVEGLVDEFVYHKGLPLLQNIATADDFESLDDTIAKGPRRPDGSLPVSNFLRLKKSSPLRNAGVDIGLPYEGSAPDLGAFQTYEHVPRDFALAGGFQS